MTDISKAIEALDRISHAANERRELDGGNMLRDCATIRAALEAQAEPVCKIVFNGCQHGIQDMNGDAFDMSKYPNVTLYAAPPTTAEVKAQVLEEVALRLDFDPLSGGAAKTISNFLKNEAKRLREDND